MLKITIPHVKGKASNFSKVLKQSLRIATANQLQANTEAMGDNEIAVPLTRVPVMSATSDEMYRQRIAISNPGGLSEESIQRALAIYHLQDSILVTRLEEMQKIISDMEEICALPLDFMTYKGVCHFQLGEYEAADKLFEKAKEFLSLAHHCFTPQDCARLYAYSGMTRFALKQYEAALVEFYFALLNDKEGDSFVDEIKGVVTDYVSIAMKFVYDPEFCAEVDPVERQQAITKKNIKSDEYRNAFLNCFRASMQNPSECNTYVSTADLLSSLANPERLIGIGYDAILLNYVFAHWVVAAKIDKNPRYSASELRNKFVAAHKLAVSQVSSSGCEMGILKRMVKAKLLTSTAQDEKQIPEPISAKPILDLNVEINKLCAKFQNATNNDQKTMLTNRLNDKFCELGELYISQGQYNHAVVTFDKCHQNSVADLTVLNRIIDSLEKLHHEKRSEYLYDFYFARASVKLAKGLLVESFADFELLMKLPHERSQKEREELYADKILHYVQNSRHSLPQQLLAYELIYKVKPTKKNAAKVDDIKQLIKDTDPKRIAEAKAQEQEAQRLKREAKQKKLAEKLAREQAEKERLAKLAEEKNEAERQKNEAKEKQKQMQLMKQAEKQNEVSLDKSPKAVTTEAQQDRKQRRNERRKQKREEKSAEISPARIEPVTAPIAGPIPSINIPESAVIVIQNLVNNGVKAYLGGGCVTNLLLGIDDKEGDLDIIAGGSAALLDTLYPDYEIQKGGLLKKLEINGRKIDLWHSKYFAEGTAEACENEVRSRKLNIGILFANEKGCVVDFLKNNAGYQALKQGVIDTLDDDADRVIREDPVQGLRAIKYAHQYGFAYSERLSHAIDNNRMFVTSCRDVYELNIYFAKMLLSEKRMDCFNELKSRGILYGCFSRKVAEDEFLPTIIKEELQFDSLDWLYVNFMLVSVIDIPALKELQSKPETIDTLLEIQRTLDKVSDAIQQYKDKNRFYSIRYIRQNDFTKMINAAMERHPVIAALISQKNAIKQSFEVKSTPAVTPSDLSSMLPLSNPAFGVNWVNPFMSLNSADQCAAFLNQLLLQSPIQMNNTAQLSPQSFQYPNPPLSMNMYQFNNSNRSKEAPQHAHASQPIVTNLKNHK